jgi:WD40 repeat protein
MMMQSELFVAKKIQVTLFVFENLGLILSGSWDKTIKIWNLTAKNYTLSTINVSDRVHALNNYDNYIAAATGDKKLIFYDIR